VSSPPDAQKPGLLQKRALGRTGLEVFPLGVGTGSLAAHPSVTDEDAIEELAVETLRTAIDAGFNYIDTSPGYRGGDSDRRVGLALRDGWRERVVLATKVGTHPDRPGDFSGDTARWIVAEALEVIGTETLDVVLVHDPDDMAPVMEPGGAVAALENLKSEGTIQAIGLGVQNHDHLRLAIESDRFDVIQSPYDYNLMRTTAKPLLAMAAERKVGFTNASPFLGGLLAGIDPDEIVSIRAATGMWALPNKDVARARELWKWATASGVNLRAIALQFCLREERIATTLIGPRTPSDVLEAIADATTSIPNEVWSSLLDVLPTLPAGAPGGEAAVGAHPPHD